MSTEILFAALQRRNDEDALRRLRKKYIPLSELKLSPDFKLEKYKALTREDINPKPGRR